MARYVHNDRLRDALDGQAFAALTASPGARAYYDQQRARGTQPPGRPATARQPARRHPARLPENPHALRRGHRLAAARQQRNQDCRLTFKLLGCLAAGWPARLPIAIALAAAAAGAGIWGALATRGLAPQPRGQAAARLGRAITIATVAQLAASIALPFILSALGRPTWP